MKRIAKVGMSLTILIVLSGCYSFRTNTTARNVPVSTVSKLEVKQPVALKNSSPNSGEIIIGKWSGWKVYGDLHKFTESSLGAAKNILERQNIKIQDNADKVLELSVYDAKSEQGPFKFTVTTALRVRTGDGLQKEYVGVQKHGSGYGTTPAIEKTLAQCLKQMLYDKDIINYLEN